MNGPVSHYHTPKDTAQGALVNPFADESDSMVVPMNVPYGGAVHSPTLSYGGNNNNLSQRERELAAREAELAAKEAELNRRTEEMRKHGGTLPPNFPSFYPIVYHDIDADIPAPEQERVKRIFKYWMLNVAALLWNVVACFAMFISHPNGMTSTAGDFGWSFFYVPFITVASFVTWYRALYTAFQKNSGLSFYTYLLFGGLHNLYCVYMCIGIPGTGSSGVINTISVVTDSKWAAGVFGIIDSAAWGLLAMWGIWIWKGIHSANRAAGHTLDQARSEAVGAGLQAGVASGAYSQSRGGVFSG